MMYFCDCSLLRYLKKRKEESPLVSFDEFDEYLLNVIISMQNLLAAVSTLYSVFLQGLRHAFEIGGTT